MIPLKAQRAVTTAGEDGLECAIPINRPQRLMFVLNPRAGSRNDRLAALLRQHLTVPGIEYEFRTTEAAGHAEVIAREAARDHFDIVVAVGGDGTVNEVGRGLLHSPRTALAIIPSGSGNGVARHLRIPVNATRALKRLIRPTLKQIDVGHINGHPFFCTAGLGFDAHVSRHFAGSRHRGLVTYARIAVQEYRNYQGQRIHMELNGVSVDSSCYVLAFANASQYGNNAYIAPSADVTDGLLDLCLIERLPLRRALRVAYGLAAGDLPKSSAARYEQASEVLVRSDAPIGFHVDGDYFGEASAFSVTVAPLAIAVCV